MSQVVLLGYQGRHSKGYQQVPKWLAHPFWCQRKYQHDCWRFNNTYHDSRQEEGGTKSCCSRKGCTKESRCYEGERSCWSGDQGKISNTGKIYVAGHHRCWRIRPWANIGGGRNRGKRRKGCRVGVPLRCQEEEEEYFHRAVQEAKVWQISGCAALGPHQRGLGWNWGHSSRCNHRSNEPFWSSLPVVTQ